MKIKITPYIVLLISFIFVSTLSLPSYASEKNGSKISVVVIDPGHGGKDPGASIGHAQEKDIVLDIAIKLGSILQQNHPDVKVIYTRTKDVFIPLHKRAEIANKSEADLFISIHVNAVDAKSVQGTETFVLGLHRNKENLEVAQKENAAILLEEDYQATYEDFDPNSDESYIMFASMQEEFQNLSVLFASNIQDEFRTQAKRIDRSVKMAGFLVLRRTTMPSVLIETGFLSHSKERDFLLSQAGQSTLAKSIYKAFYNYKTEVEEKSEFNMVSKQIAPPPASTVPVKTLIATKPKVPNSTIKIEAKPEKEETTIVNEEPDLYYSVQIIALKRNLEPTPENFNGETKIFKVDSPNINRYFSGKFETFEKANAEKNRIQRNYESAFVVAFRNNELISVKKALENR